LVAVVLVERLLVRLVQAVAILNLVHLLPQLAVVLVRLI
jgi:hypothetical protein